MPTAVSPAAARACLPERLRQALAEAGSALADAPLTLMDDKGLAHEHVRIEGTGLLARLPKQSQMGLSAPENIAYQKACYARASASGHVPRLHGHIPPGDALPRGGLIVEHVDGRPARLPGDLPAIVTALARIHSLPVPPGDQRAPLADPADPLADLLREITAQAAFLEPARVARETRAIIASGIRTLEALRAGAARPARRLISFDAHPGNFLVRPDGSAVLVDLEKCRYSAPPLDLAHATLYTSTTWDIASSAVLTAGEVEAACRAWQREVVAGDTAAMRLWLVPLRRAMWLWSVTWCAKWRAVSGRAASGGSGGEDWSQDRSEDTLVRHVRDRVEDYLRPSTARRVADECAALEAVFGAPAPG